MGKATPNLDNIIIKPLSTEKSTLMEKAGKYLFLVKKEANRIMVQKAVEQVYKTKVVKVNILPTRLKTVRRGRTIGKKGLRAKKAIVTLAEGKTLTGVSAKSSVLPKEKKAKKEAPKTKKA